VTTSDAKPAGDVENLDIVRIMEMIPHRYPMLMIDRIVQMAVNSTATGVKNVTANEAYFQGHFPERPIMPGVMIIESMAQTAAVLVVHTLGADAEGKLVYFMSIDNARFRRPVVPGDAMLVEVTKIRRRGPVWKFASVARVDDEVVAEATFAAMILDE
jgi:3-hydroxyacyl-[acyl-carrier-protein] dehydratase